jgi:hypothetical protein
MNEFFFPENYFIDVDGWYKKVLVTMVVFTYLDLPWTNVVDDVAVVGELLHKEMVTQKADKKKGVEFYFVGEVLVLTIYQTKIKDIADSLDPRYILQTTQSFLIEPIVHARKEGKVKEESITH